MKVLDRILGLLERSILQDEFVSVETEKIELKDLSHGTEWKELCRSVCAFLNTEGGIVIIGLREKNKGYKLTGYNSDNESKLKEIATKFTDQDGVPVDLTHFIGRYEIREFLDKSICVLYVEKLPEEQKFALYNGLGYVRKLTGDHKLTKRALSKQLELKQDLAIARELKTVNSTTLADLDVNKLNEYLNRLNFEILRESYKANIEDAIPFLERKKFTSNEIPTLLGILVCGKNPEDILHERCQVDAYVRDSVSVAQNKKIYKDNIIALMEKSVGFVLSNIATGISIESGGSMLPEYPLLLLRETVNNALAHRDYSIDRFVSIIIFPGKKIEIKNPGAFREQQYLELDDTVPIRQIVPIPHAPNPRLVDILKTHDRWEGQGTGMAELTNMALENRIDVAYYLLHNPNEIVLCIRKGRVLDRMANNWLDSFESHCQRKTNGRVLSEDQKTVLAYLYKAELLNRENRYTITLTPDNNHKSAITSLKDWGLLELHPQSSRRRPVYLVDRTMLKWDFFTELRSIFQDDFDGLKSLHKEILNTVFHFETHGSKQINLNAALIGDQLFFKENTVVNDVKIYNDFKRKIRKAVRELREGGFIIPPETAKSYKINKQYKSDIDLFNPPKENPQ